MARSVTITGARAVEHLSAEELVEVFVEYVLPFAVAEARFFVGGAVGVDTAALEWLAEETKAEVTVVVPRTVRDQPDQASAAIMKWPSNMWPSAWSRGWKKPDSWSSTASWWPAPSGSRPVSTAVCRSPSRCRGRPR